MRPMSHFTMVLLVFFSLQSGGAMRNDATGFFTPPFYPSILAVTVHGDQLPLGPV